MSCQQVPAAPALSPAPDQLRWGSLKWPWAGEFEWPSGIDWKHCSDSAMSMRQVEELLKIFLIALHGIKEFFKIKGSN